MNPLATTGFTGPRYYDELLGPITFGPMGMALAGRVPVQPPGDVLELACGTGLVTRELRRRLDPSVQLVATDLNATMLNYARQKSEGVAGLSFEPADMMALPFPDGRFGVVVCGFGMMFAPDRLAALREARRVMKAGAWLLLSVWDRIEENTASHVNAQLLESMFPGDPEIRFRLPYELADRDAFRSLLEQAGFGEISIEAERFDYDDGDPMAIATGQMRGTPRSALIEQKGVPLDEVIRRVADALVAKGGSPYRGHAQALLATARAR